MSHQKQNIEILIEGCLKNDSQCQMEIYRRYSKAMFNVSHRIVKDSAEAEDVMQESFLAAFTKLETFSKEVTFGAWLKKIVINNSIHALKKKEKMGHTGLDSIMYRVEESPVSEGEAQNENQLMAQKVMQVMGTLKENYRVALSLYLVEGYDHDEISELMGISYANCRTTISRAKESLRKKMSN